MMTNDILKQPVHITEAEYNSEGLPQEYVGNPFTEALPGILSHKDVIGLLRVMPTFAESERNFPNESRIHFIARLFWQFFQPMGQHLRIWDYLSICIRQGYIRRNPLDTSHVKQVNELYAAAREGRKPNHVVDYIPNSVGFAIIGVSGVGKSTAVSSILSKYPQVIHHTQYREQPLEAMQIVWLKLDCSHNGSERGLCLNFLREVDHLVGTGYYATYEKRATVDTLLTEMTRIASAYSLGVLLVDECQHLNSGSDSRKLLNFFVTLENTIGVPVVLMGTPGALPMLQGDFRSARRCCAHGDIFWKPLQWDKSISNSEWELFLSRMWNYQWIRKPVKMSVDYLTAMYEETQGIEALAVILFMLLQEEAIRNSTETIRVEDVHAVAQKHMKIVQPMLDALRSGDSKKIARYSDVVSSYINDAVSSHFDYAEAEVTSGESSKDTNMVSTVGEYLKAMGFPAETAYKFAGIVFQKKPKEDVFKLVGDAAAMIYASQTAKQSPTFDESSRETRRKKEEAAKASDPEDLRNADSYEEMTETVKENE